LFGYEKGAFTGARTAGKPGKFELAHRGTIFLDEIGDLPMDMQPKLLRVLEEKEFERIGGNRVIRSDFRLIAATNQNLTEMVGQRRFRSDLYYRLNVFSLPIPPLRERRRDILPISRYLLNQLAGEAAALGMTFDDGTTEILEHYDWPGNVRELSNVLERAMSTAEGRTITPRHLPLYLQRLDSVVALHTLHPLKEAVADAEIQAIRQAMQRSGNNKARAARFLGIHRTLLYKKMHKYNMYQN
jgi:transcriptional regulator with PAS, ATPase and Fis domain